MVLSQCCRHYHHYRRRCHHHHSFVLHQINLVPTLQRIPNSDRPVHPWVSNDSVHWILKSASIVAVVIVVVVYMMVAAVVGMVLPVSIHKWVSSSSFAVVVAVWVVHWWYPFRKWVPSRVRTDPIPDTAWYNEYLDNMVDQLVRMVSLVVVVPAVDDNVVVVVVMDAMERTEWDRRPWMTP